MSEQETGCQWAPMIEARVQGLTPPQCADCGRGPCRTQLACEVPDDDRQGVPLAEMGPLLAACGAAVAAAAVFFVTA
ncbi:MAG: hypothetical protein RIR00_1591 [Pseudomonadota bacterium]|jgi:hypothetical protein